MQTPSPQITCLLSPEYFKIVVMVAFLASDVASDIVGQIFDVDGGKIIKF